MVEDRPLGLGSTHLIRSSGMLLARWLGLIEIDINGGLHNNTHNGIQCGRGGAIQRCHTNGGLEGSCDIRN